MLKHIQSNNSQSFINPSVNDSAIQPNAVDVSIKSVTTFVKDSIFILDENDRTHRDTEIVHPDSKGYFLLKKGNSYTIRMIELVTLTEGEAGFVVPRSTLIRNGVYLFSGLYDSGYSGTINSNIFVSSGDFRVQVGTRVGQFLLFESESLHKYDGYYQSNFQQKTFDFPMP
jgi:dUTP pyrophosphatase